MFVFQFKYYPNNRKGLKIRFEIKDYDDLSMPVIYNEHFLLTCINIFL